MDFRVEEIAPCRKKVTVTIPVDRVREEMDAQFKEINEQVALPGFRSGKAPRKLLEARFGPHVRDEVKGKLVEAAYKQAIEDKKVAPLGRPDVDVAEAKVEEGKPFEFAFEVTTRPEFSLGTWKGLEVKVPAVAVTDADVDQGIEALRLRDGTLETSSEPLVKGDVAIVDWKANVDGAEAHAEEGAFYGLGRGVLDGVVLEGADAALAGGKVGTTATVRGRAAADDPRPALAGKEFDVALTVKETKRFQPAPLDEQFLKRHDLDDVEELRRDVRRRILRVREKERERAAEQGLLGRLVESTAITLPEELVKNAVEGWAERRRMEAQSEGRPEDDVARELASGEAKIRADVEADLRQYFILDRIAEDEKTEVGEQELTGAVEQMARESGRSTGELVQHFQEDPSRLAELRTHLRHQKAREALRRAATIVEEQPVAAPAAPPAKAAPKKGK